MRRSKLLFLFVVLLSMANNKLFAYDIAVENADGVTIYYNYINDGKELEVTYGNKSNKIGDEYYYKGNVVIPEEVIYMNRTRKVTSIGGGVFSNCQGLTSVTIPNSVTIIGENAFNYCKSLTSVTIGNSVTSIGNSTFYQCHSLTSVSIPNSLTSIGERAFYQCWNLTSVTIPNNVTSIGDYAFYDCGLTSVTIPNSVTSIGESTFCECRYLTSVTIGNGVTSIGKRAFKECYGLISVHISDIAVWCNIKFGETYSNPLFYAHHLYLNGEEVKDLIIPNNVTTISFRAFNLYKGLISVVIPNSVTSIGEWAFSECDNLTSVTIGNGVTSIGSCAFYGCGGLNSVTIGNSVTSIGSDAFRYCSSLPSVTIPNSVTSIGDGAFSGCKMSSIYSLIRKPFTIKGKQSKYSPFDLDVFNNTTLFVPVGTIDKYKATDGWKDFLFIEEFDTGDMYTLSYVVDGVEYKTYKLGYGETITPEEEPTKEGYTFSGWSDIPTTMPAEDVTVTGTFTINKYKLTYIIDGEEYKSYNIEYGSTITSETEPAKEGYTFSGWSDIPETMPANDVTVTGAFTVNKYKITYIVDGEEYKTYEVEYGAKITPEPSPTKEGYTFSGWSDIPETMPANDVIITGTFTMNIFGKCAIPSISYNNGKLIFKSETEDVTFKSTITDSDISSYTDNEIKLGLTYNISVYATKIGYEDSETATATLCWIDAEPKTEGITNVAQVRARAVMIQSNGNVFSVSGADEGTEINVYDTAGKKVGSSIVTSDITNIPTSLGSGSIAIIRIGEKAVKVLIK